MDDEQPDSGEHDREDRGDDHVDALPEDLDITAAMGPYEFPDNGRRRIPGLIYLGVGALTVLGWFIGRSDGAVLVNQGVLITGILLALLGVAHLVTGWHLEHDDKEALVTATREVGFPVGHAAAQMGWRGFLSRPTWRILVYSTDEPPSKRGLVLVDGVDGEVLDTIVEDNPASEMALMQDDAEHG